LNATDAGRAAKISRAEGKSYQPIPKPPIEIAGAIGTLWKDCGGGTEDRRRRRNVRTIS
jgi:hypothetical protein